MYRPVGASAYLQSRIGEFTKRQPESREGFGWQESYASAQKSRRAAEAPRRLRLSLFLSLLSVGRLCVGNQIVIRERLVESAISRLIAWHGWGELETLFRHVLNQLGHRFGLDGELPREVVADVALPEGSERIVQ